ncbi:MAG: Ig-like domain-containing protein, partial [Planctomycetes bacterium]|nr:Ig-like domain-containing protein [Planctomycetota bacterium]
MRVLRVVCLLLPLLALPAAVVHVKADATGTGTGASWANAYPSLANAIAASRSGDQLWIAAGTYKAGSVRSSTFSPKAGTTLYGGFRGSETALAQRSGDATLTVLSGDIGIAGVATDNAYHVVWIKDTGAHALYDLTITGGYADIAGASNDGDGGGLYIKSETESFPAIDVTLDNCRLVGNQAHTSSAFGGVNGGTQVMRRCLISGNRQVSGSPMYGHLAYLLADELTMDRCVVTGNSAEKAGAGLQILARNIWTSCLVVDNALQGLMLSPTGPSSSAVTGCTLVGNRTIDLQVDANYQDMVQVVGCILGTVGTSDYPACWQVARDGAPGFARSGDADGLDGQWFTADDGYRLTAGSPCLDIPGLSGMPATDLVGLARPQGRAPDHGAYERDQGGQAPVATTSTVTASEDTDLAVAVLGSDADSSVLTGRILSLPARGSLLPTLDGAAASGPALAPGDLPWRVADAQRRVLYRPPADLNGAALDSFTVDLDDGVHTSFPATITVDVTAVNDAPTLTMPAHMVCNEDAVGVIPVSGISAGTPALADGSPGKEVQVLTVSATASDPDALLSVAYTSPGDQALITCVPVPDFFGDITIVVSVRDDLGAVTSRTCVLHVNAHNDPPGLWMPLVANTLEDTGFTIAGRLWGAGAANESAQLANLQLFATAVDPGLLTVTGVEFSRTADSEVLIHVRPVPDASGQTQVAVTVIDDTRYLPGALATTLVVDVTVGPVNDPPVVARNQAHAVTRGGRVGLDPTLLRISDPDNPPAASVGLVLTAPPRHGVLERDGLALAAGGGFTLQDLLDGRVAYRHDGGAPVGDSFTAEFSDGIIARPYPLVTAPITVDGRALPLVVIPASGPTWSEGGPAVAVAATAAVSDADDAVLPAGTVTVTVAGGDGGDLLAIASAGVGAGQIDRDGASVRYGGRTIGSWQGGTGGIPLTVALAGPDATLEAVQALVRAVVFSHPGGSPSAGARTVTVVVDDGTSGASPAAATRVDVVLVDDPPVPATVRVTTLPGVAARWRLAAADADSA